MSEKTALVVGFVVALVVWTVVSVWFFKVLWNAVAPIYWKDAPQITYWQSFLTIGLLRLVLSNGPNYGKKN